MISRLYDWYAASLPGRKGKKAAVTVPVVATSAASGAPGGCENGILASTLMHSMKAEAVERLSARECLPPTTCLLLTVDEANTSVSAAIEVTFSACVLVVPCQPRLYLPEAVHIIGFAHALTHLGVVYR